MYVNQRTTIGEYVRMWLARKEEELKINTFTRYEGLSKRIVEYLGAIPLGKITQADVYDFYHYLRETKSEQTRYTPTSACINLVKIKGKNIKAYIKNSILQEKNVNRNSAEKVAAAFDMPVKALFIERTDKLSDRTISHYHKLLYEIMKDAAFDGAIADNIMIKVRPPKITDAIEARCLDIKSAQLLVEYVRAYAVSPFKEAILLFLYTGMRRGEVCGLEWRDIDFQNKILTISRASYYLPKRGIFTDTPKTPKSRRIVSFDEKVAEIFKDILIYQKEKCNIDTPKPYQRLIVTEDGDPINPNNVTKYYHKFIREYNLSISTPHTLRHTNASLMIAANTPITTVSGRLGHSNPEITLRYYAHQISSENEKAAKAIENMI
ncbi:MAG: site-specific integrase [Eubacterium sp.]|nr:site-specific integrase [Eubacterium sp.]